MPALHKRISQRQKEHDEYTIKQADRGLTIDLDYVTRVFDPSERGTWDEVRAVTDVGWFCYSEERLSADDHLDRVARAGFQFDRGFVTDDRTWSESSWVIKLWERMKT
jgi:hypothetical protein